jgi:hypothetical protein
MLLFRSEETLTQWCETRELLKRPTLNLTQLWYLAMTWYENRLTVESRRPAPDEMVEIFARIGLEGRFWDPKADQWHPAT